jgi:hypothetical protein
MHSCTLLPHETTTMSTFFFLAPSQVIMAWSLSAAGAHTWGPKIQDINLLYRSTVTTGPRIYNAANQYYCIVLKKNTTVLDWQHV